MEDKNSAGHKPPSNREYVPKRITGLLTRVISYRVLSNVLRMLLLAGICQINVYTFIYQIVGAFAVVTRDGKH